MIRKLSVSLLAAAFGAALSTAAFAVDTPIIGAPKPVPHSVTEERVHPLPQTGRCAAEEGRNPRHPL